MTAKQAGKILRALEEGVLIPAGLYLDGGLSDAADGLSPEIGGMVIRADGRAMTERDRKRVEAWLASTPGVIEFSITL